MFRTSTPDRARRLRYWSALLIVIAAPRVSLAVLVNGDFSDPVALAGYTATGSVVGEPTGEFAQLETDGSFLRTLEQTVGLPATNATLAFDFAFSTAGSPSAGFPDSFAVSLLTSVDGDFLDILVVDGFGVVADPSDGIEGLTGALPIDVMLDSGVAIAGFMPLAGGTTFSGRASLVLPVEVLAEEATLFIDLFDEMDGFASIAAVDNLSVSERAVPEPASAALVLLGIAGLLRARRCRRTRRF